MSKKGEKIMRSFGLGNRVRPVPVGQSMRSFLEQKGNSRVSHSSNPETVQLGPLMWTIIFMVILVALSMLGFMLGQLIKAYRNKRCQVEVENQLP